MKPLEKQLLRYLSSDNTDSAINLINSGQVDVNAKRKDGITALHIAAGRDQIEIIELLLSKGATINPLNVYQENPLFFAALNYQSRAYDFLLKKGGNDMQQTVTNSTPNIVARANNLISELSR